MRPSDSKDVSDWAAYVSDQMEEAVASSNNEMELREHVHRPILDALEALYGMGASASSGEMNTRRTGPRSPLDRLYGGVAVEWEWDMSRSRREHGAEQALNYLENLRTSYPDSDVYTAIVCDGKQWGFLHDDPADAERNGLFALLDPSNSTDRFTWVPNSPAACGQFLELVGAHKKAPITNKNLTKKFGPESDVANHLVTFLSQSAAGRLEADRTDTLYIEWRRALDVVYGDLDENDSELALAIQELYRTPQARPLGELLFVLHTYFAMVGRVIAVELMAVAAGEREQTPSSWRFLDDAHLLEELRQLENGRLPGDINISNLFEADLFSWWADSAENNNDLLGGIRDLLNEVSQLAFPQIAFGPHRGGDVLRDLYQALIPRKLRKALGEFLTPYWLAEASLRRLKEQGADLDHGRVIDPTCGTGTFIVPVLENRLRRLKKTSGDELTAEAVQAVLDSVAGIDLNPVAITATRVNFVLALGDLATLGNLTLPVWRADSIIVPEPSSAEDQMGPIAGIKYSSLTTSLKEPFTVPASMDSSARISALRGMIDRSVVRPRFGQTMTDDEVQRSRDEFAALFADRFGAAGDDSLDPQEFDNELLVARNLFSQITDLAVKKRDGVWARLVENAYAPLFAGKFDVVVGNPPWLAWGRIPEQWRRQTEYLWKSCGLWYVPEEEGDSFSLQSADMATLVYAVSLLRYAAPKAYVGLLTPASLINADPGGRAFRQFHLFPNQRDSALYPNVDVPFRPTWVDDWSRVAPFAPDAANKPIFLISQKGLPADVETKGAVWERVPGHGRLDPSSWWTAQHALRENLGSFSPVDPKSTTSAWRFQNASRPQLIAGGTNKYTFGKGLDTRGANGVYFVDISRPQPARGNRKATIQIKNIPSEGRNKNVTTNSGRVEADLVYPLLRGRDVSYWNASPMAYIALPHDPQELDRPLETSKFRREYPGAYDWFKRHRDVLTTRKTPPSRGWNMADGGDDWCRVDGALKHMQTGHTIVVREFGNRPAAALVHERTDFELGGRTVRPLIDHKLMLCTVGTRNEALYLVAMINSTPMQDLLESFVNSIAVSPKSLKRLNIPDFDSEDGRMSQLVTLAETATAAAGAQETLETIQPEMDRLVLEIVVASADYKPQPKAQPKARQSRERSKGVQLDVLF